MSYERFFKRYWKFTVGKQVVIHVGRKAERTPKLSRARPTMVLVDPATGETSKAFLLMAYLPLGSPSYAESKRMLGFAAMHTRLPTSAAQRVSCIACGTHRFVALANHTLILRVLSNSLLTHFNDCSLTHFSNSLLLHLSNNLLSLLRTLTHLSNSLLSYLSNNLLSFLRRICPQLIKLFR